MKVMNTTKKLICFNLKGGKRIDVLPGVVTDAKELDVLEGKDKIFDHYLETDALKKVKGDSKKSSKKSEDTKEA